MSNEIVIVCHLPENSDPVAPQSATGVFFEIPTLKDYNKAEERLERYLESERNNTSSPDNPDDWINNIRGGVQENGIDVLDWPAVLGGTRDPQHVADLFTGIRSAILGLKRGEYWECAEILYKWIPAKYEYIAGYREFWTLLAVYVVPEWPYRNFGVLESDSVRNRRYALNGSTATRDALAQFWWKYHILTNALDRKPEKNEWNNISSDVWQERTNVFKNQEVVRVLASGRALKSDAGMEAAKRLGKYLFICDAGSLAMDVVLVKDSVPLGDLSPTAAQLKVNVERDDTKDGLRKVQSLARLDAYTKALTDYLASGVLPKLATREGAALLALAALGGYRLNRPEWRDKGVDAGNAVKVLEAWRTEGAEYVSKVIEEVRSTLLSSNPTGQFEFLGLGRYTTHSSGPSNNMLITFKLLNGKEVHAGYGYFKVGDMYTRTEIMAAGLVSFDDQFKHWAEGSGTLVNYPLLVGNQNPGMYPGESLDRAGKTVTVHSEKGARESNSGHRYLTKDVLLFWQQ